MKKESFILFLVHQLIIKKVLYDWFILEVS